MGSKVWLVCFTALVTVAACSSSDDDADGTAGAAGMNGGSSPNGGSPSGGSSAGKASGGAGRSAGGNAGHAGTSSAAGRAAGDGGESGAENGGAAAGDAGAPTAVSGAGGSTEGEGNSGGEANGGEGGADAAPAVAYVSTRFGDLFVAALDPRSGAPTLLESSPIDVAGTLNGVAVSPNGKFLFVPADPARIDTYPIAADGSLPAEPSSSAPIDDDGTLVSMALDPLGRFAYGVSPFSGLVHIFKVDALTGALTLSGDPLQLGAGPAHRAPAFVAPEPTGHFVYVTQMAAGVQPDDGVRGYSVDQTSGQLTELPNSPFNEGNVIAGAVVFRPDGKFLFSAGNGVNAFAIDAQGKLSLVEGSPFSTDVQSDPWAPNITIDPAGRRLYVSNFGPTRHVTGFAIDAASGALEQAGDPITTSDPYSLALGPGGRFLYIGQDSGQISAFKVNRRSGALTELADSPFPFGGLEPDLAFVTLR